MGGWMNVKPGGADGLRPISPPIQGQLSTVSSITIIIVLYVAAWGGLLLSSGGVYWDDWVYVDAPPGQTLEMTRELGLPWVGFVLLFLLHFGPVAYHILSFLLFLSVGMSILGILRRVPCLTPNERVFLVALVLVLPLMAARHVLTVQHYALSCALFFFAWYLLARASPPGRLTLAAAGVLFAVSFTTSSLLVFYLLPLVHLWYQDGYRAGVPLKRLLFRYWPLLALPAAWYLVKISFFQPYGVYAGYNQISPKLLVVATVLLAVSVLPLVALYLLRGRFSSPVLGILTALVAGIFLTALAVSPYVVVGQHPPFVEWQTRDELLMPLGIALIVLALCRMVGALLGRGLAQLAGIAVLACSVIVSATICASYFVDWQKQQTLIEIFRATPALEDASTVIFHDDTTDMNIFSRSYRFYEWNGLMRRAFGDESRVGVNDARVEVEELLTGSYSKYALYGARDYVPDGWVLHVTISSEDAGRPWYQSLPYFSRYLPSYGEIRIETSASTVEEALDEVSGGK